MAVDLEGSDDGWRDIRAERPTSAALAISLNHPNPARPVPILRAHVDLMTDAGVAVLREILRFRVPFVFHDAKPCLHRLRVLGLTDPIPSLFDTYVAAACLDLGSYHKRDLPKATRTTAESIQAEKDWRERKREQLSLEGQCRRHGIALPMAGADLLVNRAATILRLYYAQQPDLRAAGLETHLHAVEFPFIAANARIEWNGVHVDLQALDTLRQGLDHAIEHHGSELREHGIDPPTAAAFLHAMRRTGLGHKFQRAGQSYVADDLLRTLERVSPAVRSFRLYRMYDQLRNQGWVRHPWTSPVDGRIHPRHIQLGAATGRNSCASPNLPGIPRIFRPVVTAPPGRALIEFDYAQIEVGIAAAEFGDHDLVDAYNAGDVYAAMAQRFFADDLSAEERSLHPDTFKQRLPHRRNTTKTIVLAILYNMQAPALATRLGNTIAEAERLRSDFLDTFPTLRHKLDDASRYGAVRGYASIVSGLRRRTSQRGRPSPWTKNFLRNTPVQGSAAVVFKRALILIDQRFAGTNIHIVLPIHDSVLIECPLEQLDEVERDVRLLMEIALRGYYPQLTPKVTVNRSHPHCWNKDGHADSIERFLADPTFRLDAIQPPDALNQLLEFTPETFVTTTSPALTPTLAKRLTHLTAAHKDLARDFYEERAAILEFEAGLPRDDAETRAQGETLVFMQAEVGALP